MLKNSYLSRRVIVQFERLIATVPTLLAVAALVLWSSALPQINVNGMTDLGLISVLPPVFFVAFGVLILGFCLALRTEPLNEPVILLNLLVLVLMLYAT